MSSLRSGCWILLWLMASSIGFAHEGHQPLPTKGVQVDTDRGYITLSGQARSAIGLETTEVSFGEVSSSLFAYAETVAPWNAKAFGSAQISGRITRLLVRPGDIVSKDQVVAELSSRELELLQLEFSQAKMELALNKQLLEMTRPSANAGAVPMQRLLDLENAYQQSENSLAIARIRAKTLGVDSAALEADHEPIRHLVRSPIAGKVIHSDLSEGKFVDAFEHLFEIVNSDETWVRLQILEKDLFNVSIGQKVSLEFADGTVRIDGTIDRLDAGLDPKTKVGWAWVTVASPNVVPGLVGNAVIHASSDKDRIAIPLNSVFSDGLQTYVFVEEASTRSSAEYKKRNVTVGYRKLSQKGSANSFIEVTQGDVYPGDRVVVKGGHELSSLFFLGVLKLSQEDRKRLGIKTATATHRQIADAIPLSANVTLPPENRSVASSQLAGTIHSHTLSPGKVVRSGDLLMEIASPEFYTLQLELLKTTLDADLARQRARRLQEIGGEAISRRVLLETAAKAEQLDGRTESLKRQLVSLGLNSIEVESIAREKQIIDFLPIRAAIDGQLVSWVGTLGETVVANQALVEIQNLNSIWIEAHLPTQLRSQISIESRGQASVLSNDNVRFPVHVNRIGPIVSETTRTQRIWLLPDLNATSMFQEGGRDRALPKQQIGMLRDGTQLTVLIKSTDGPSALVVPSEAVLRDGLNAFVFVQKADDYIDRRRVSLGRADGEFIEISSGVVAGEAVVSAGGRELQTAFASLR